MSFDLGVTGGRIVTIERWRKRVARFGVEIEFHPAFRFENHSGYLPAALVLTKPGLFQTGGRYRAAGRLASGFELGVWSLGPTASPEQIESRKQFYERALEEAAPRGDAAQQFPRSMLDDLASDKPQSLSFVTSAGRSGADYLAQVVCAASYAFEAGAELYDPQQGELRRRRDLRCALAPAGRLPGRRGHGSRRAVHGLGLSGVYR